MARTLPEADLQKQTHHQRRGRQLLGVTILGTGSFVPENVVKNEDLVQLGCDSDWIVQRTGILERRHATADQATSDLAIAAAEDCLENAGVAPEEIDLILVATMTPDHYTPSTACLVQDHFGCQAAAMDLNAACSGFTYALITAAQFVHSGGYRRVLVIGADVMSRVINPTDVKTYPLFGDGAGAALVGPGESLNEDGLADVGILAYQLGADGSGGDLLKVPAGGSREPVTAEALEAGRHFLHMDGRPVFKWAVRTVAESLKSVMEEAGVNSSDLAQVILHQANIRIIDAAISDLDLPADKVHVNLERYGNTSAASIPLVLRETMQKGLVKPGDKVLLCGFGAGLTWASCVIQL